MPGLLRLGQREAFRRAPAVCSAIPPQAFSANSVIPGRERVLVPAGHWREHEEREERLAVEQDRAAARSRRPASRAARAVVQIEASRRRPRRGSRRERRPVSVAGRPVTGAHIVGPRSGSP